MLDKKKEPQRLRCQISGPDAKGSCEPPEVDAGN